MSAARDGFTGNGGDSFTRRIYPQANGSITMRHDLILSKSMPPFIHGRPSQMWKAGFGNPVNAVSSIQ